MALTATATADTRAIILNTLGMKDVHIVTQSPDRPNFTYSVHAMSKLESTFGPCIQQLKEKRRNFKRLLIFCRTIKDCSQIYEMFLQQLGNNFTEPPNAPNLSPFRLVDMYTSVTTPSVKKNIEESIKEESGILRVLICTNAFGMGVDCKGVHGVVHWRPPKDLESYIQETGRGGRDGQHTDVQLHYIEKKDFSSCDNNILSYCTSTTCRRKYLMSHFIENYTLPNFGGCKCCDICKLQCKCTLCQQK